MWFSIDEDRPENKSRGNIRNPIIQNHYGYNDVIVYTPKLR